MIEIKDIEKLAQLARLEIPDGDKESLRKEIGSILEYVGQIKKVSASGASMEEKLSMKNVLRDDANPHESGFYTETLLAEAPKREKNFVKVKKILG